MLTKEIKYRYKIAIFYRFLPIPIFNFWTLLIPIPIFAFNNIPIAIPISPNIPINRYWYRLYPLLVFPIKLYPNSLLLPDVLKTVKLFSTRTHVLKLRKVCSNSGFCYTLWHVCFWQTSKSKVPSRDSSPNFGPGVFFKNDVDSVVSFESFRALKLSKTESFRVLKISLFESFRVTIF